MDLQCISDSDLLGPFPGTGSSFWFSILYGMERACWTESARFKAALNMMEMSQTLIRSDEINFRFRPLETSSIHVSFAFPFTTGSASFLFLSRAGSLGFSV
jgi:hypothetical protein